MSNSEVYKRVAAVCNKDASPHIEIVDILVDIYQKAQQENATNVLDTVRQYLNQRKEILSHYERMLRQCLLEDTPPCPPRLYKEYSKDINGRIKTIDNILEDN